jgi:probable HAF family extracellular repeat protein
MLNRSTLGLTIFMAVGLTAGGAMAATTYNVTDLGTLAGQVSSVAQDVNEAGHVVGYGIDASGLYKAFVYDQAHGMVGLGTLGGASSTAWGINDLGQITGSSSTASGVSHAFLAGPGGMVDLTPGAATASAGYDINNSGKVVGDANGQAYAFAITGDQPQATALALGYPGLPSARPDLSAAYAVNASGGSVGHASYSLRINNYVNYDLAIQAGSDNTGGVISGVNLNTYSTAKAINDSGVTVGYASFGGTSSAFVTQGSALINLGSVAGYAYSGAADINNLGQIVGDVANPSSGASRAFISNDGQTLQDLNTFLAPQFAGSWTLLSATAINESGQIVGQGLINGAQHAYLLTPVPEAATNLMMGLGMLGLVGLRLRRLKAKA